MIFASIFRVLGPAECAGVGFAKYSHRYFYCLFDVIFGYCDSPSEGSVSVQNFIISILMQKHRANSARCCYLVVIDIVSFIKGCNFVECDFFAKCSDDFF